MEKFFRSNVAKWTITFAVLAFAVFVLLTLRVRLHEAHIALVFLLVVLGASAWGGRLLGATTASAAFLLF
jgi:K+-sensing histidine kinase KdpD